MMEKDADRVDEEIVASDAALEDESGRPQEPEAGRASGNKAKIEKLERELDEARRQAESHLDDLRRLKAEFENYRKRVLKEQTNVVEHASQRVVEKLLPVLDNFELALLAADRSQDYEKLVRGVEIVFGELLDVLHKEGVSKIEAQGKPFDPERHEAVMQVEGGEGEPVVVDVLRPGYTVKGRVVRPAMVKVARR
jgi:molecular chaperone GrpE